MQSWKPSMRCFDDMTPAPLVFCSVKLIGSNFSSKLLVFATEKLIGANFHDDKYWPANESSTGTVQHLMKFFISVSSVLFLCIFFFSAVSCMELRAESQEIQEFTEVIRHLFHSTDPAALTRAKELAETDAVQNHFNDFSLFMECIKHFRDLRHTVPLDDPYLAAFRILLGCPALDISMIPTLDFYHVSYMVPAKVTSMMLQKLKPCDKFIKDMLDFFAQPLHNKNMVHAPQYLAWSYGQVSDEYWIPLLELQVPIHQEERNRLLKILLSRLIKKGALADLKDKIAFAARNGYTRAAHFLSPIVNLITFIAATSDTNENELWLPSEVIAMAMAMIDALLLDFPVFEWEEPIEI